MIPPDMLILQSNSMTRFMAFVGALILSTAVAAGEDAANEQQTVEQWRSARVAELTSDTGWLTLVGLFWLDKGDNTFGRAPSNRLVLDHPALAPQAGTFKWDASGVHFTARPGSRITHGGQPVSSLDMVMDSQGEPTVVSSGPLRFFIIERSGKVGVRVRDIASPRRREFVPISYYPVATDWVFNARFEPYEPHRRIKIINILGLEEENDCPGALIFNKDGHEYRLDAVLESPTRSNIVCHVWRPHQRQGLLRRRPLSAYAPALRGHCAGGFQPGVQPTLRVQQFRDVPAATGSEQTGAAGGGR